MKQYFQKAVAGIFGQMGMLLLIYSIIRVIFFLYNIDHFPDASLRQFIGGIRFDLSAIAYLNAPYIIAMLLPLNIANTKAYRRIANIYFVIANSFGLLAALIDIAYFPYVSKRLTADIFSYMGNAQFDFNSLAPLFLKEFWWIALIFAAGVVVLIFSCRKRNKSCSHKPLIRDGNSGPNPENSVPNLENNGLNDGSSCYPHETGDKSCKTTGKEKIHHHIIKTICYLAILFLTLTAMRGGWQLRPLSLIHAGEYASPQYIPIVLNTPFTLIRTLGKEVIEEKDYFKNLEEAETVFSPDQSSNNPSAIEAPAVKNVIMVVLEGISQELFKFYNPQKPDYPQYCPFLDSIAAQSWVFNGISNGKRTMEGIPAIICGIPTLMEHAFIETPFAMNSFKSPVSLLAEHGFHTLFFHGAENGSMNFESFCRSIGFQKYYGMNEYPTPDDYDGSWGIPDRSFLHFMAETLCKEKEPFFGCVMTLSSHHPFQLPKDAGTRTYKEGTHPMHKVSGYTDAALREFFQQLSKESWYDSTLFIITADHAYEGSSSFSQNPYGNYRIPILFYHPAADTAFFVNNFMQQTDIMPSLFAYLKIPSPMICFGQNVFDRNYKPFAVNYISGTYQIYKDQYLMQFDGEKVVGYYNLEKDPDLKHNLSGNLPGSLSAEMESKLLYLKAYLQSYSTRMIHNQLQIQKNE